MSDASNHSSHRAFHLKLDELVHLDGVFHGQLLDERLDESADDQGSGERKVGGEWFDGEGVQVTDFDAPVPGLGLGKKGVPFKASIP